MGISGIALSGGHGVSSRKFGLTTDNLLSVRLVDASLLGSRLRGTAALQFGQDSNDYSSLDHELEGIRSRRPVPRRRGEGSFIYLQKSKSTRSSPCFHSFGPVVGAVQSYLKSSIYLARASNNTLD